MHSFIYAQYISRVVKDWQCSQVYNVIGHLVFLGISSWSCKSQLKLCPHKVFRGRYHFLVLPPQIIVSNHGQRLLLTSPPSHQNCNEDISHQNCGEWESFHTPLSTGISVPAPQKSHSSIASCILGMPWDKKKLRSQTVSLSSYWLHKK